MKQFQMPLLSEYRTTLMGIAILAVIVYHFGFQTQGLMQICGRGYIGVDIFFFCSGLGLYYSLHKKGQPSFAFCKYIFKRFSRIYPSYIIFAIIVSFFIFKDSVANFFLRLSTIPFWSGSSLYYEWYIPSILCVYLIFPWLSKLLDNYKNIFLFLWCCVCIIPFAMIYNNACDIWQWLFIYRLPILFGGIYSGKLIIGNNTKSQTFLRISFFLFILGCILFTLGGHFTQYAISMFTPIFMVIIVLLPICSHILRYLSKIGNMSLELYCANVIIMFYYTKYGHIFPTMPHDLRICLYIVINIGLALLIQYISTIIRKVYFINSTSICEEKSAITSSDEKGI